MPSLAVLPSLGHGPRAVLSQIGVYEAALVAILEDQSQKPSFGGVGYGSCVVLNHKGMYEGIIIYWFLYRAPQKPLAV